MRFNDFARFSVLVVSLIGSAPLRALADVIQPIPKNSIYLSKAPWTTHEGKTVTLSSLRGSPTVVSMLYTSCKATCPLTLLDLQAIEKGLTAEAKSKVQFAIFSFDSSTDTPAHLKEFANSHNLSGAHWTFHSGKVASVRELAALLGIRFKLLDGGGFDHSNIITVLDTEGVIIHKQVGLKQVPTETIALLNQTLLH